MKIALKNTAIANNELGEENADSEHFKERCYYLVQDDYDFFASDASEIVSTEWINKLTKLGRKAEQTIEEAKQEKYDAIDYKTNMLIGQGFTYNSDVYSLSLSAQMNWTNLNSNKDGFTYPVKISKKNNSEMELPESEVDAFWMAAKNETKGHLDSGRELKVQVYNATTFEEIDSIIDNR